MLRVKAIAIVNEEGGLRRFTVLESWKGSYQVGEEVVAKSFGTTTCGEPVAIGTDVLVAFDDLAEANFYRDYCPEYFPERRRELEEKYLRKLSPKYQ